MPSLKLLSNRLRRPNETHEWHEELLDLHDEDVEEVEDLRGELGQHRVQQDGVGDQSHAQEEDVLSAENEYRISMSGQNRTRQLCSHFFLLLDLPEGHELGGRGCEVEFVQDARLVRRDRRTDVQ